MSLHNSLDEIGKSRKPYQNISAPKQTELALKRSEGEKIAILDSLIDLVVYQTREMKILWANKAACQSVQMQRKDLISRHCFEIWADRYSPCEDCPVLKAYAAGKSETIEKKMPDGRFWRVIGIPSKNKCGDITAMMEVAIDITERKRARKKARPFRKELERRVAERTAALHEMNRKLAREIELKNAAEDRIRNLSQQLLEAQEMERQMIARELHDRVAQDLSSLQIGINTLLPHTVEIDPAVRKRMTAYTDTLQRTINIVRDLTYDLRLPGLEGMGLVKALSMYCEDFAEKSGLKVQFQALGMHNVKINFDMEMNLYRLIQEGLNNIRKWCSGTANSGKAKARHRVDGYLTARSERHRPLAADSPGMAQSADHHCQRAFQGGFYRQGVSGRREGIHCQRIRSGKASTGHSKCTGGRLLHGQRRLRQGGGKTASAPF